MFFRRFPKMPEMPEIETLARQLRKTLVGKRIAMVRLSGLPLRKPVADTLAPNLHGRTIHRILRRGKYLIVELEGCSFLLIHLGMSGRLFYHALAASEAKHTQAVFTFTDSTELEYRDHRRFGLLVLYEGIRLDRIPEVLSLGRDPLSRAFRGEWLWPLLQKSRTEIKSFLLDQRKVAGLGNIYVCESLFAAGIHPKRRCFTLTMEDSLRLADRIRNVVKSAVRHRGTSFSDFMDSNGTLGKNQDFLMVFQKEGMKCVRCGKSIRRIRQANRSTFYCPHCQK
jgi:formamidopyrimidine-DNA glycosylase